MRSFFQLELSPWKKVEILPEEMGLRRMRDDVREDARTFGAGGGRGGYLELKAEMMRDLSLALH
jgi:hypothetical protein